MQQGTRGVLVTQQGDAQQGCMAVVAWCSDANGTVAGEAGVGVDYWGYVQAATCTLVVLEYSNGSLGLY